MPPPGPDEERLRRAREAADRIRAGADVERRLRDGRRRWGVRAGSAGRAGRVVGGDLAAPLAALEDAGWLLLHDLRRRGTRLGSIDHVAVGRGGVVGIGQVRSEGVAEIRDEVLRLNAAPYTLEAARFAAAVTGLLTVALREGGREDVPARAVLCVFPATPVAGRVRPDVDVVGRTGLVGLVLGLPAVLAPDDVPAVRDLLSDRLHTGDGLRAPRHP